MKLSKSMICVVLLGAGLQLWGQQPESAVPVTANGCPGQLKLPHGIAALPCKPMLPGVQTPPSSSDLPRPNNPGTFITFDGPGANATYPLAINLLGVVTGYYASATACAGFLRDPFGNIITFDVPGNASCTVPSAINLEGMTTGFYCDVNNVCPGFVRTIDGTIATFDVPQDVYGMNPSAINVEGTVTGYYYDVNFNTHGFLRARNGTITLLDIPGASSTMPSAIDNDGTVAGSYFDAAGSHGFLRKRNGSITTIDVPGGNNTAYYVYEFWTSAPAVSINRLGTIASNYFQPIVGNPFGGNFRGMLRKRDGTFQTFDAATNLPCCIWTYSTGIADDNTVTGLDNDGYSIFHGFFRTPDGTITLFDVPGAGTHENQGTLPLAINDFRVVTGFYRDTNGAAHGFLRLPF